MPALVRRPGRLQHIMHHRLFRDPGLSYMMAAAFGLVGWSYFADPTITKRSPVGGAVYPYDAAWNGLYLLAAALILLRLLRGGAHWEGGGLIALTGGLTLNGTVALAIQGPSDIRSYVFFVFAGGCALRLRVIARG